MAAFTRPSSLRPRSPRRSNNSTIDTSAPAPCRAANIASSTRCPSSAFRSKLVFDICGENLQLSTQDCDCAGACCLKVETASESPISIALMASHVLAFLAAVESDVIVQFPNDRGLVKLSDGGVYQHFVNPLRAQQPTAAKSSP
jgi:hypothetical protein